MRTAITSHLVAGKLDILGYREGEIKGSDQMFLTWESYCLFIDMKINVFVTGQMTMKQIE